METRHVRCMFAIALLFAATTGHAQTTMAMPGKAYSPLPTNGAVVLTNAPTLKWTFGTNAFGYAVYFGTSSSLNLVTTGTVPMSFLPGAKGSYSPGVLAYNTTYYWRVDMNNEAGCARGDVWTFTVGPDTQPPTPNPAQWAISPHRISQAALSMTAVTASDPNGVEYRFECTQGPGHSSDWQTSSTWIDTGVTVETNYNYRVTTRDCSPRRNTGMPSDTIFGTIDRNGNWISSTHDLRVTSLTTPKLSETTGYRVIRFEYVLKDTLSHVCGILPMYSIDKGLTWQTATLANVTGDGIDNLASSPTGTAHSFKWAVGTDLPDQTCADVVFRIIPICIQGSGPAATTNVFAVDNQPRMVTPSPGAIIGASVCEVWWTRGTNALEYKVVATAENGTTLTLGPSQMIEIVADGLMKASLSGIPTDGSTVDTQLWWRTAAAGWQCREYSHLTTTMTTVRVSNLNHILNCTVPLQGSSVLYTDRSYSFIRPFPDCFEGQTYIVTANNDKTADAAEFLTFDIDRDAIVVVANDARFTVPQAWLADWDLLPFTINTTDGPRKLFAKRFAAGRVTLPANCNGATPSYRSMYNVILLPASHFLVSNVDREGYVLGRMNASSLMYKDRNYTFRDPFPPLCEGQYYLITANGDKYETGNQFLGFDINKPSTIVVALDARFGAPPDWLSGWMNVTGTIYSTDTDRVLYAKNFPAGHVTLGGNRNNPSGYSMYSVVIVPGKIFEVANPSKSSYRVDMLSAGERVYTDRAYTFTDPIPAGFEGKPFIRTANDDKGQTSADFLAFDINEPATVVVAFDTRYASPPEWLQGWTILPGTLNTTDTSRMFYSKSFPAGRVTLGGNDSGPVDYSMYSVIVLPDSLSQP